MWKPVNTVSLSRECHHDVMLQAALSGLDWKRHSSVFLWCLCKPNHMQLFQTMQNWGKITAHILLGAQRTAGLGQECWAVLYGSVTAPSKPPWNSEPLPGDRTAGRKGLRQCNPTLCPPGPLITKVNQVFPLRASGWNQLTLQIFLGGTAITHSKYSWNMHSLSFSLPGSPLNFTLPAQNSTAAINCRSGKISTVSFSLKSQKVSRPPTVGSVLWSANMFFSFLACSFKNAAYVQCCNLTAGHCSVVFSLFPRAVRRCSVIPGERDDQKYLQCASAANRYVSALNRWRVSSVSLMLVARFPKDHPTPKENSVVLKCRHRAKLENHRFVQPAADLWQLRSPVPTQRREKFSITLNGSRPSESGFLF